MGKRITVDGGIVVSRNRPRRYERVREKASRRFSQWNFFALHRGMHPRPEDGEGLIVSDAVLIKDEAIIIQLGGHF
jgi:hypothetical protein